MELAIAKYKRETALYIQRACRFRRSLGIVDWSINVRRMQGGKRFRPWPYQVEMMTTPFRQDVQMTVFQLASRMGKTEVMSNLIGHGIAEQPRRILTMYPTISQSEKWSKETLMNELVHPTPELDSLIGDGAGQRKSGNTITHKIFPGGLLSVFGSNSPGELRRAKGNLLIADEIDAIEFNESDEGDPLEIFWVRGSEYPDTIKVAASYPSLKSASKIEALMLQSDWRVWMVPCIHCGHEFVLHRDQLRYDRDAPQDAWIECPGNGCKITDEERIQMVTRGHWKPTRPFNGIAGFHGSRMMSLHDAQKGFTSHLHWAADQELKLEKAANREKAKRVLINTFDAETYQPPEEEKPDPVGLAREAYPFLAKVGDKQFAVPAGVLFVTGGADVQNDRIEFEFVGHGLKGQMWGLGYHILQGSPIEPKVWQDLDALLQSTFVHPSGKILKPARVFIDSKFKQTHVLAFARPRARFGVFGIYGSVVLGAPIVSAAKKAHNATLYEVGTHEAKSMIYQSAHLRRDTRLPEEDAPHNYYHYPLGHGYTPEYFHRLLIEKVSMKKGKDGNFYEFFEKPDQRSRNEPLDIRVYNIAAARSLNPDYQAIAAKMIKREGEKPGEVIETLAKRRNFILG